MLKIFIGSTPHAQEDGKQNLTKQLMPVGDAELTGYHAVRHFRFKKQYISFLLLTVFPYWHVACNP